MQLLIGHGYIPTIMPEASEIYAVLEGKGKVVIDGETVELEAGDWIRISPAGKRQFFAAEDSAIRFICIQVQENSLEAYTMEDAVEQK